MIDYTKNWELCQEQLQKGRITIVGAGPLTHFFSFYMAGLGIQNIRIIDDTKDKVPYTFLDSPENFKVDGLKKSLLSINEELSIESVPLSLDTSLLGYPNVLLDLTNNPLSKKICQEYFYNHSQIQLFISASTKETVSTALFKRTRKRFAKKLSKEFLKEYASFYQGSFSSGMLAAIILDEVRKTLSPLQGDSFLEGKIHYNLNYPGRFGTKPYPPPRRLTQPKKVLLCGAGGIGTYVALHLALKDISFDVYDPDIIASHNVARQLFYAHAVGEKKVDTLQLKLKQIVKNVNINAFDYALNKKNIQKLPKYDAIICCADNWEIREILNDYAVNNNIPYFNTAVTAFSAIAEAYLPEQNNCLACHYDFQRLKTLPRKGCSELQETNVVMTNAFIGAFLVGELHSQKTILQNRFTYQSKAGNKRKFNVTTQEVKPSLENTLCLCENIP